MDVVRKYLLSSVARNTGGEGGGGGGQGAGGNSGGQGGGQGQGGQAGAGGGQGGGGGAGQGAGGQGDPPKAFYADWNLDPESVKYIEDRKLSEPGALVKSWVNADKVATSRNVLEKPDPKNLKDWKGWTDLGWVPEADKYAIAKPDAGKLGFEYDGALWDGFRQLAHEHRVPLAAAQAIHDGILKSWGERVQAAKASGAKALSDTEGALRSDWGPDYERNSELARRAAGHFANQAGVGPDEMKALQDAVKGAPALLKMFHAIGAAGGEANLLGGDGGGSADLPQTLAGAEAELRRMHGDKDFANVLQDARHPQHKDYVAQRQRLIKHIAKLKAHAA